MIKISRYFIFLLLIFCSVAHASGMFAKAAWWEVFLFAIFMYGYLMVHSPLFWGVIIFIVVFFVIKKIMPKHIKENLKQKKKNAPPNYNWVCPKCDTVNQAYSGECTNCHESVL